MTYVPDHSLIHRYATRYNWEKKNLLAVLSEFGPLSGAGQEQLIKCLVLAFGSFQLAAKTKERITPSQQRNTLKAIEKNINSLLQQLKKPSVSMWLTTAGILREGKDQATVNTELKIASDWVSDAIRVLNDLYDRAKAAGQTASQRVTYGRGGDRHRPGAKGQLIRDAIAIYSHMRAQHPDSGGKPALGGPMLRFVHAVGKLFGNRIRDPEIREVWVWKSKQKKS